MVWAVVRSEHWSKAARSDTSTYGIPRDTSSLASLRSNVPDLEAMFARVAVALLLAFLAACESGTNPPVTIPATYDLLYEGFRFDKNELYVLPLSGGEPTRILPPGTVAYDPAPSPDGSKIAFTMILPTGAGDVFVVNRDGTGLTQLTDDEESEDQPAWSPDGSKIAYRSFELDREGDIFVMNANGTAKTNLTPDPLPGITDEGNPAWAPDGARIAYRSTSGGDHDIWTMRADGSEKQRLTNTPDFDTEPTWSPNGQTIAFRRSTTGVGSDIALVATTGGAVTRISMANEQRTPQWTPDGTHIAFADQIGLSGTPQIWMMRPDGTGLSRLTTNDAWKGGAFPAFLKRR